MASKPVEVQTCNPQSCYVECRLDDNHWFKELCVGMVGPQWYWLSELRWGELHISQQDLCDTTPPTATFGDSGIYHASDGYIYTRNKSVGGPQTKNCKRYEICRRPA